MKFDYVIGNPPYQDEVVGDQKTFTPPVYHKFLDAAYAIGDRVMMVHPGRFLFNAGATPREWNERMLADEHLKVIHYEADGNKIFPGTDIKGGVVVTYHDMTQSFGAISLFIPFEALSSVLNKVVAYGNASFGDIVFTRTAYRLTDVLHNEHPDAKNLLSEGHMYDMSTNILTSLPDIFFDEKPDDGYEYIGIFGLLDTQRVMKYVRRDYVNDVQNLEKYKVFIPKSNGSGALGEVLSTPLVGLPLVGHTESFMSIGCFDTEDEAQACLKYVKTKFARAMLGILKVTQDNPPEKWKYVPMQDFTFGSDIDWSQDVAGIDQQLYKKYGLDDDEIAFIEEKVRAM